MVEVKKYFLKPTALVPNSSQPLLHYPGFFSESKQSPESVYDTFHSNGWELQWIFRYGPTQKSHYHSAVHECMAVLTGTATIRFGVADAECEHDETTIRGSAEEDVVEVEARAGDVFVLPAGVAHKTFNTSPTAEFKLLTPGDGHHIAASDKRKALAEIELSGFTMLGAYPIDGGEWDFAVGGEHVGHYEAVWSVPKPENDPVLGAAVDGIAGQWK